jgi:hypothetical protein
LRQPQIFSHSEGVYKYGKRQEILLLKVKALQLLSHEISGDDESPGYTSYQLNLIMNDGSRENVVSYGQKDNAIADSQKLADYLGLKLWNGI